MLSLGFSFSLPILDPRRLVFCRLQEYFGLNRSEYLLGLSSYDISLWFATEKLSYSVLKALGWISEQLQSSCFCFFCANGYLESIKMLNQFLTNLL